MACATALLFLGMLVSLAITPAITEPGSEPWRTLEATLWEMAERRETLQAWIDFAAFSAWAVTTLMRMFSHTHAAFVLLPLSLIMLLAFCVAVFQKAQGGRFTLANWPNVARLTLAFPFSFALGDLIGFEIQQRQAARYCLDLAERVAMRYEEEGSPHYPDDLPEDLLGNPPRLTSRDCHFDARGAGFYVGYGWRIQGSFDEYIVRRSFHHPEGTWTELEAEGYVPVPGLIP